MSAYDSKRTGVADPFPCPSVNRCLRVISGSQTY
jgi:hypothetical protein